MSATSGSAGAAHTVADALGGAVTAIGAAGCETPRLDAEVLLANVLGVGRERLITDRDLSVSGPAVRAFQDAVRRRAVLREPVAYIVGERGFRHLQIHVDARALIPRPESELLVEVALALPRAARVIDLCTGSGAVALALKDERPDLEVHGSDVSAPALELARENSERLHLEVDWHEADLLSGIPDEFDAVLANPPYVAEAERQTLAPEILRHEPAGALFAGEDGFAVIAPLISQLSERPRVRLAAIEIGAGQGAAAGELARRAGFQSVRLLARPRGHRARAAAGAPGPVSAPLTPEQAIELQSCVERGGVAVFPSDTVYGLCCDPDDAAAAARLYELKGRPPQRPSAVMFFGLERLLSAMPELTPLQRDALDGAAPGPGDRAAREPGAPLRPRPAGRTPGR